MLEIVIPAEELWDEANEMFIEGRKEQKLVLEHSLVSLSKWESKWHKPFLSKQKRTTEELIDYIKCMTITQNVDPDVYNRLTNNNIEQIQQYIENPMTATTFDDESNKKGSRQTHTSEIIYYWMITLNIPFECQKWHLNRLLTLIKVCSLKNQPPKKISNSELMARNMALNEARKQKLKSRG